MQHFIAMKNLLLLIYAFYNLFGRFLDFRSIFVWIQIYVRKTYAPIHITSQTKKYVNLNINASFSFNIILWRCDEHNWPTHKSLWNNYATKSNLIFIRPNKLIIHHTLPLNLFTVHRSQFTKPNPLNQIQYYKIWNILNNLSVSDVWNFEFLIFHYWDINIFFSFWM